MYRRVVRTRGETDHAEATLARVCEAVREKRRSDPAAAPTRRHATAFEPGFGRRRDGELAHADDPASGLGDEERPAAMGHPAIEDIRDAIMPAPDGADGLEHLTLIRGARAPDDQVHAFSLGSEGHGGGGQSPRL